MRIISQDKTIDIPYDNNIIFTGVFAENKHMICCKVDTNEVELGEYASKEKCLEVMQKIRMQSESLHNGGMTQDLFFHMPKEVNNEG